MKNERESKPRLIGSFGQAAVLTASLLNFSSVTLAHAPDPDVILTSTDDPGQLLFDIALRAPRARVVYLVRATIAVPFGPDVGPVQLVERHERSAKVVAGPGQQISSGQDTGVFLHGSVLLRWRHGDR